jgi:hypothetical protein
LESGEVQAFAKENNLHYFETSAKTGVKHSRALYLIATVYLLPSLCFLNTGLHIEDMFKSIAEHLPPPQVDSGVEIPGRRSSE